MNIKVSPVLVYSLRSAVYVFTRIMYESIRRRAKMCPLKSRRLTSHKI